MDEIDELLNLFAGPLESIHALDSEPPTMAERDELDWALHLNGIEADSDGEAASNEPIETRGKGSQKAARDAGAIYLYQIAPRGSANYRGFRTVEERDKAADLDIAAGLEVVERCEGNRPARAFIDVDATPDATDDELATICEAFKQQAAAINAPADRLEPIVNSCDRADKRSRHLISDGWAVPDGLAVKQFADGVRARITDPRVAKWIDGIGTRVSYGLRVAGVPKAGDASAILSGPLTWLQTEGDPVVTPPRDETRELQDTKTITLPSFVAEGDDADTDDAETEAQTPAKASSFLTRFLATIAAEFADAYTLDDNAVLTGTVVASYDRVTPGYCEACEKDHDRAGAYVSRAPDGSLFMRCRRTPKQGPPLRSKLVKVIKDPEVEPEADGFDDLGAGEFETVGGPGVYNSEAIGDDGVADLYVGSAWGTGKSQHNAAIVRALVSRKPRAVVIVISSRKSLSAQLSNDISAVSYDKIRGSLDAKKNPITVWQVDSLARVGPDVVPDLLIVDELSQLTAHAWQGGSSASKAAAGVSSLRALVQRAGRIIVSDNDLTSSQVTSFRNIRPDKSARVVRNEFKPWAETSVKVLTGQKSPALVRAELFTFLDAQNAARTAGQLWAAAAAPCHSLKIARGLAEEASQRYGSSAVRLYSSETDDVQKRRDFGDAFAAWDPADGSGPLLVVYTSTVSVGVSCPSAKFSHCFAFFGAGNCAATQSAQMLFRCRKLRTVLIAYDGKPRRDLPQQPADLFRWAVDAQNLAALPDAFRHDRNPFITTPTASDPEALGAALRENFEGGLWVANAMEANRSARWFVPRLRRIIERAGMTVAVEAAAGEVDQAAEESAATATSIANDRRAALMAGEMTRRHSAAVEAVEVGQDPDDDRADKTAEDKAGDRARYIARDFGKDPKELAALFETTAADQTATAGQTASQLLGHWLSSYEAIAPAYRRACRVVSGLAVGPRDLAIRSDLEADEIVREVFGALGAAPCAETLEVNPDVLTSAPVVDLAKRINKHASRLFDDRHGAERTKPLASTQAGRRRQAAASSLNAALNVVGAQLWPEYDSERSKARGIPSRFRLVWAWEREHLPSPRPDHPTKPTLRNRAVADIRADPVDFDILGELGQIADKAA